MAFEQIHQHTSADYAAAGFKRLTLVDPRKDPLVGLARAAFRFAEYSFDQREYLSWALRVRAVIETQPPFVGLVTRFLEAPSTVVIGFISRPAHLALALRQSDAPEEVREIAGELVVEIDRLEADYAEMLRVGLAGDGGGLSPDAKAIKKGAPSKVAEKSFAYTLDQLWAAAERTPRLSGRLLALAARATGVDPVGSAKDPTERWGRMRDTGHRRKKSPLHQPMRADSALLCILMQPDPALRPDHERTLRDLVDLLMKGETLLGIWAGEPKPRSPANAEQEKPK